MLVTEGAAFIGSHLVSKGWSRRWRRLRVDAARQGEDMLTGQVIRLTGRRTLGSVSVSRRVALTILSGIYGGAVPFLGIISRPLLYTCYGALLICLVRCFSADGTAHQRMRV